VARLRREGRPLGPPRMGFKHLGPRGQRYVVPDPEAAEIMEQVGHARDVLGLSWWKLAAPNTSGEHSYEDSLAEFLEQYDHVRYPWGTSPVTILLERAKQTAPPPAVADYPTEGFRFLAGLCRELQREVGDKPFFLSSHQAADMLGRHPKVVWQWLRLLCRMGVLELVQAGNRHKANEYRYHEEVE